MKTDIGQLNLPQLREFLKGADERLNEADKTRWVQRQFEGTGISYDKIIPHTGSWTAEEDDIPFVCTLNLQRGDSRCISNLPFYLDILSKKIYPARTLNEIKP